MSITVETGAGVVNANSYAEVADADAWIADNGADATWTASTTAQKEAALKEATRYLDSVYDWKGLIVHPTLAGSDYGQETAWPRSGVQDEEGRTVPTTLIPRILKEALYLLAIESRSGSLITADAGSPGYAKREKLDVLEVEYSESPHRNTAKQRDFVQVDRLLIPALAHGKKSDTGSGTSSGRMSRSKELDERPFHYGKDSF